MASALDDPHALASPPPTPAPRAAASAPAEEESAASRDHDALPLDEIDAEEHDEFEEEEEEDEVEEMLDDRPMRIYQRLFVGSIDAARNSKALEAARIGCILSLLGDFEEFGTGINDEDPATDARRLTITMEDAPDEPLLERLPSILSTLERCLYVALSCCVCVGGEPMDLTTGVCEWLQRNSAEAEAEDFNVLVHWCVASQQQLGGAMEMLTRCGLTRLSVTVSLAVHGRPPSWSRGSWPNKATRSRPLSSSSGNLLSVSLSIPLSLSSSLNTCVSLSLSLWHSDIRPWVDINPGFRADLALFSDVLHATPARDALDALQGLPRLDFSSSLVADVVSGKKRVTMRLPSDVETDARSDLAKIWAHGVVVATAAAQPDADDALDDGEHLPFAYLRVDRVAPLQSLGDADDETLRATGFESRDAVLRVLQSFYPSVTLETPLCVVHFKCLCATSAASA
ncbi:hypothetical protein PINS_up009998 [Pythium insidiosum]|nr:hypothetical protein PINS_up009998 [Pythium insidiosum]